MPTMRRLLPLLLSTFILSAQADIDRTKKPEAGPAPEAAFPDYVTEVLPNGLKVFVIEDDRKPTITMRLVIKAGDAFDSTPGIAGFVASLLNRGTATRDALTFAKAVDSLGATLEAGSGPDSISVSTSGLTKVTDPLLVLFVDAVMHPAFAQEEFAKAQKRTLSSLTAQKKEPRALAGKLMNRVIFGNHPYGKFPTPESVKEISREDVVGFYKNCFSPRNASLAIVGDVKAADILPKIEEAFGVWEGGSGGMSFGPVRKTSGLTIHLLDLPGSVQSNVIVCRDGPSRRGNTDSLQIPRMGNGALGGRDSDLPEMNVMNSILGGGFSGRLFQNLREKHGYTYGSSSAFGYNRDAGYFQATAETRNDVTAAAIMEILGEIKRIRMEPVAEPELELQRQYNIGNYLLSLENAGRVAARVQDMDLYGLAPNFYKTYAKRMAAVTPAKVKELAEKYLSSMNAAIVVVGDAKQIRESLEKIAPVVLYDTDLKVVK
jgi:zinc protease